MAGVAWVATGPPPPGPPLEVFDVVKSGYIVSNIAPGKAPGGHAGVTDHAECHDDYHPAPAGPPAAAHMPWPLVCPWLAV